VKTKVLTSAISDRRVVDLAGVLPFVYDAPVRYSDSVCEIRGG
jgi:hypothetical protein